MPKKKQPSDFEVMEKMADLNQDIRMTGSIAACQKNRNGGTVTMQVDSETFHEIAVGLSGLGGKPKYLVALYAINREQFLAIKEGKE